MTTIAYAELTHPARDGVALALAYDDEDDERFAEILAPYELDARSLYLLVTVVDLVGRGRDLVESRQLLDDFALAGAGCPE